ncbi:hypothetical protein Daudx_1160 [Candidatus Desulforudis audaxviator]|nr:hypothetical protein Daudx_1160 [Candidatus Desulforudis audaxviator]
MGLIRNQGYPLLEPIELMRQSGKLRFWDQLTVIGTARKTREQALSLLS